MSGISRPAIDTSTRARAIKMYESGIGCQTVAAELGIAKDSVLNWVRADGGKVRPPGRPRNNRPKVDQNAPIGRRVNQGGVVRWVAA